MPSFISGSINIEVKKVEYEHSDFFFQLVKVMAGPKVLRNCKCKVYFDTFSSFQANAWINNGDTTKDLMIVGSVPVKIDFSMYSVTSQMNRTLKQNPQKNQTKTPMQVLTDALEVWPW